MSQNLISLVYVSTIAVYVVKGITYAIAFGVSQGMTSQEVIDLINYFETQKVNAAQGLLP